MKLNRLICISVVLAVITVMPLHTAAQSRTRSGMKKYQAKYHIIYTDLPKEKVYESIARVNAMAEEYHDRTKGFEGKITSKLPFYLHNRYDDYLAAKNGGAVGSAGVYTGKELRAVADSRLHSWEQVWKVVQHEGFHQFAHMVICEGKRNLPIWLSEGLAEYYGEAIWTGDNMITGVIDPGATWQKGNKIFTRPGRLQRVQKRMRNGEFITFSKMVNMSHAKWNAKLKSANYDQVWSMIQFFVHAKKGKYRKAIGNYLDDMANGGNSLQMFKKRFGNNLKRVENEYRKWWLSREGSPTADLYDRALVETLTSFMARAKVRKIRFKTAQRFFELARDGRLYMNVRKHKRQWLPNSLLDQAIKAAKSHNKWKIKIGRGYKPVLQLYRKDGTIFEGSFVMKGRKISKVSVKIIPSKKAKR